MSKAHNKSKVKIIIILILALLIAGAIYGISRNMQVEEKTAITSELVESTVREAKELTTTKYHYKNIASYENSQEFYGVRVPFTTKRFIYTYAGVINAGVDLDQVEARVDDENKIIEIKLPEAKILSHEIDEDSVMMFDEKESVFNQLKLEDFSTFRSEEKTKVETEAVEKGLLTEANDQSKKAVEEILSINPLIKEEYTVNVKF